MHHEADPVERDPRWAALVARTPPEGLSFLYGVRTTGIYCRVGCPAPRPLAKNVVFFDTHALAEAEGYRPCLRCCPNKAEGDSCR